MGHFYVAELHLKTLQSADVKKNHNIQVVNHS